MMKTMQMMFCEGGLAMRVGQVYTDKQNIRVVRFQGEPFYRVLYTDGNGWNQFRSGTFDKLKNAYRMARRARTANQ